MSSPTSYQATRDQAYAQFTRPTYKVNTLLEIAAQSEARYKELLALHPAGTVNDERNLMREISENALSCATHLEEQNITGWVRFVGPFGKQPFKKGVRVRILKGARIFSTSSKVPREGEVISRIRVVTLHDADSGYVDRTTSAREVVAPKITWAGTGGYWYWTDPNNAEIFPESDTDTSKKAA